jgi:hypothetical protein
MLNLRMCGYASLALVVLSAVAAAEEAVPVGGALALLNKPKSVRAAVILIPGSDGNLRVRADGSFTRLKRNMVVRTRRAYLRYGVASLTIDIGVDPAAAVRYMRNITPTVVVVGTSRGTLRVPAALSAKPSGIVLTSGFLDAVRAAIGSPAALPPTLIVHHRHDHCHVTPPGAVDPFKAWGGAKVRVVWMNGGVNAGHSCRANAYHGFNGLDSKVVAVIARFVTGL